MTAGLIVDLFAGAGGWEEGLRLLGHDGPVVGLELDADACATRAAAGHLTIRADVAAYPAERLAGKVAGLIASPPCQDWSTAGSYAGGAGATGHLVGEVLRWVDAVRPEWVACEQVRGVLPVWRENAHRLRASGYHAWAGLVDAADYGVPQRRTRAVLLASRTRRVSPPARTHGRHGDGLFGERPWLTTRDTIGWDGLIDRRTNSAGPRGTIIPTVKARCDRPSPTVTGQAAGGSQWVLHATDGTTHRLTIADAAALQGFPPSYPWRGNKGDQGQQVGNAVPPPLAAAVLRGFVGWDASGR